MRHCVRGVMFLRIDPFVGSRLFHFKCHLVEVIVFNTLLSIYKAPSSGNAELGFSQSLSTPSLKSALTGVKEEQQQIDAIASHPACSVHWQSKAPGSRDERALDSDMDSGKAAGRRGDAKRCAFLLLLLPRSPSVRLGIQEEIRSKELWCSCIFSHTKKEISAARPFLSSSWHFLIDDWKWWQYINYFSFYFMTW